MRKLAAWSLFVLMAGACLAADGDEWTVYVNSRKFAGTVRGGGDAMMVEGKSFARAIGVNIRQEGPDVKVNGVTIAGATVTDGLIFLPLLDTSRTIGIKTDLHAETHRVDIHVTRGFVPPDVEKAILGVPVIGNDLEMNFLYGIVQDAYEREGMAIYHPVLTHWVSLAEIQRREGKDSYGYSTATPYSYGGVPAGVENIELFVPFGLAPDFTLHTLAHEMAHCWQYDNDLDADAFYMEGFAEWAAGRILHRLKLEREISTMRINTYQEYRQGFEYFEALEQRAGFAGCIKEMKERGRRKR